MSLNPVCDMPLMMCSSDTFTTKLRGDLYEFNVYHVCLYQPDMTSILKIAFADWQFYICSCQ